MINLIFYSRNNADMETPPVIDGYKIIYTSTPGVDGFEAVAYGKNYNSTTRKYGDMPSHQFFVQALKLVP